MATKATQSEAQRFIDRADDQGFSGSGILYSSDTHPCTLATVRLHRQLRLQERRAGHDLRCALGRDLRRLRQLRQPGRMTTPARAPNLHQVTGQTQGTSRTAPLATLIAPCSGRSRERLCHRLQQPAHRRSGGCRPPPGPPCRPARRDATHGSRPHAPTACTSAPRMAARPAPSRQPPRPRPRRPPGPSTGHEHPSSAARPHRRHRLKARQHQRPTLPDGRRLAHDPDKLNRSAEQCLGHGSTGKPCPPGSIPNADGGVVCVKP